MLSLTDRYKLLYSPPHQLDFTSLQLELLIAFHHDLTDVASNRESHILPLSKQQAAYLNTALYIAMVMTEWGEQTVIPLLTLGTTSCIIAIIVLYKCTR